jgi:glutamate racemase
VADSGFAPYGDKPEPVVAERSLAIARFLVAQGAKAIVVACNTATGAAVRLLRERLPEIPIVGVEPGLKPAAAITKSGTVGVLATERTLASEKFLLLRDQIARDTGARFLLQPCSGLADQIELGELESPAIVAMLRRYVTPLLEGGADTLVLGCTHYPLVQASIEHVIHEFGNCGGVGSIALVDTGDAVARQLARLLDAGGLLRAPDAHAPARVDGYTSAAASALSAAFNSLIGIDPPVAETRFGEPDTVARI